jgi:hypothetical protein
MKKLILIACAVVCLASCATIQAPREAGDAARAADLINTGRADALASSSAVPFMVDQEILMIKADIAGFWQAVAKSGLRISRAPGSAAAAAGPASAAAFADTFEARTFFKKYVPPAAKLVTFVTSTGKKVILLVKDEMFGSTIYGFKGPF